MVLLVAVRLDTVDWLLAVVVVVCSGKEGFEGCPSFLLSGQTFPGFAFVSKKAGLVYNLEGDAKELF